MSEYKYNFLVDKNKKHHFNDAERRHVGVNIPNVMFEEFLKDSNNFSYDILKALVITKIAKIFEKLFNKLASIDKELALELKNSLTEEEDLELTMYFKYLR